MSEKYPYSPGEFGIPPGIFTTIPYTKPFTSGSGREMSTEIDRNVISITDRANTRFKLSARIDDLPPTVQALHLQDYLVLLSFPISAVFYPA